MLRQKVRAASFHLRGVLLETPKVVNGAPATMADAEIPPANEPDIGKLVDMEMMALTPGGRERTEAKFRQLFAEGGFDLTGVIPTPSYFFILEGQPL